MAYYLKYRSQKVSELDSASARDALTSILSSKDLPHALLFTGPRGTGKTSSARILAKAVNCEQRTPPFTKGGQGGVNKKKKSTSKKLETGNSKLETNFEPCNACSSCRSITSGQSLDVIEIDAASHRGIDDIRDLREKVRLAPSSLQYKIYIIDEVHMLTTEAFNALLKTLEEPPKNVIFILCTTELHKLPETIVSRCVQVPFQRATIDDILHSLNRVVEGENLKIEDSALRVIAKHADGSFRDAQKILEQVSWGEEEITVEKIRQFIGLSENEVTEIIQSLHQKDTSKTLQLIEQLVTDGKNLKAVFTRVLEQLHQELLAKVELSTESSTLNAKTFLIQRLDRALADMKNASIPQLPLEIAILEWGREEAHGNSGMNTGVSRKSNAAPPAAHSPSRTQPPLPHSKPSSLPSADIRSSSLPVVASEQEGEAPSSLPRRGVSNRPVPSAPTVPGAFTLESLQNNWEHLLEAVKPHNHSLQALLRSTKPVSVQGGQVTIEVWYPFHFERLNSYQHRDIVANCITQVFNCSNISLQYIMGQKTQSSNPSRSNGNMISETEYTTAIQNTTRAVRDQPRQSYSPRPKTNDRSLDEDDELIKFAEEIFGR